MLSNTVVSIAVAVIAAIVAAVLTAFFTFEQWNMEQSLSREREDYETINSTATDIAGQLSAVMTLQENLFFVALEAANNKSQAPLVALRHNDAQTLYKEYITAWNPLKEQRSLIISKAFSKIDRFAAQDGTVKKDDDLFAQLNKNTFNCATNLPKDQLKSPVIDWEKASDNVATMYYCLLTVHDDMQDARDWAASADAGNPPSFPNKACPPGAAEPAIECELDSYAVRMKGFFASVETALTALRSHHQRPTFWQVLTGQAV